MTPTRARRLKRLGVALIIYTLVGFFVLPVILKWQMVKHLPALTHRAARVDAVRVNPYTLSLTIRGLTLTEPDGSTFASFSNFYANFEAWSSLFHWTWTLSEVRIGSPYGYLSILTNGQFNLASLLTNAVPGTSSTAAPKPLPRVLVHSLIISNGALEFADFNRATPFQTKFTPIDVWLTEFTTRPDTDTPYSFTASTGERESFSWRGDFTVVPLASHGRFDWSGIDLKKYASYVADFVQFELYNGKVSVGATYQLVVGTSALDLSVTNASVEVTDLQVRVPQTEDNIATVPDFRVQGAEANLLKRTARVASVETSGGNIVARRFQNGELQFLVLAKPETNAARLNVGLASTNIDAPAAPWSVLIEKFSASNYTVAVEDAQPSTPAHLLADQISFTLTNISTVSNAPVGGEFSARLNQGGTMKLAASATVLPPLHAEFDVDVSAVQFGPLQPYISEQVKLAITSGSVTTKGHASVSMEGTNTPKVNFVGDMTVNDFASVDQIVFQDFVKWKEVALRGFDISLNPLAIKIEQLSCDQLTTSVVLDTNRQPAFLTILPTRTTATNAVPADVKTEPATNALPLNVQLGLLSFTNASLRLVDFSIQPPCRFAVQDFSGTVKGLSSTPNTTADVDIIGRIDENAPFAISGKMNPLVRDLFFDLVISNRNMELTSFTPYMEKFAGYPLKKGKLSVALRYDLKQRTLKAENVVHIDQLTLGQRNSSPDATHLPVKLGIALLKDRNGKIELNVPVSGRLDDPKFSVGPIIGQVVMNMLTKAATSPFSLLGALVGGGGEELSFIEFAPGQSTISETESPKIDKLSRALFERPALNLEITGSADDVSDRAALAWQKLGTELKSVRMAELAGKSGAPASAEEIRFDPRDYARALKASYKQTFNRTRPLPPGATVATNNAARANTNLVAVPPGVRAEVRSKGAQLLMLPDARNRTEKQTNAVVTTSDPRPAMRPASLPALAVDDDLLAQMENELFAHIEIGDADLRELIQQRAQSVQRALLRTEKVEGERVFILAPKTLDAASKGHSRANLSLN